MSYRCQIHQFLVELVSAIAEEWEVERDARTHRLGNLPPPAETASGS